MCAGVSGSFMVSDHMNFTRESEEVYRSAGPVTVVTREDIVFLKKQAAANRRGRVRLCAHPNSEDQLHEMLIVHSRSPYVPPHRHLNKSESFHIIEGLLTVFIFGEDGTVQKMIPMGDAGSGKAFYYRLSSNLYHTIWLESDFVVFHEVTNGPFDPKESVNAPWAPAEDDLQGRDLFIKVLLSSMTQEEK
jgi:cupin fold WbuC family metalloprotein